jgi:hypothetical protein
VLDIANEELIPLFQGATKVPPFRRGRKTHPSTLWRWVNQGARSPSGERIFLEAVRLGGRWLTSVAALQRFAEALTPTKSANIPANMPRPPVARQRASDRARQELERLGI